MIDTKALGLAIKAQRQRLGLSQVELAKRLGVHSQTVSRYETGDIRLTTERLAEIAKALETTDRALLGRDVSPGELDEIVELPQEAVLVIFDYLFFMAERGAPLAEIEAMRRRLLSPEGVAWYAQFPADGTPDERIVAGVRAVVSQQLDRLRKKDDVPITRDIDHYYQRIAPAATARRVAEQPDKQKDAG